MTLVVKWAFSRRSARIAAPGGAIFTDPLSHNVPGSGQGLFDGVNPLFGVNEGGGLLFRVGAYGVAAVLGKDPLCQRLKPLFLSRWWPVSAVWA